jgi:hypothetical protein
MSRLRLEESGHKLRMLAFSADIAKLTDMPLRRLPLLPRHSRGCQKND